MSFEQTLEKYAALAVNVGVNIQPGQTLSINLIEYKHSSYKNSSRNALVYLYVGHTLISN